MRRANRTHPIPFVLTAAALLLAAGSSAAAERPLAVVDSQRIADEYDAARDAQEQYEKFMRELQLEVEEKEQELVSLSEEIESQKLLLGEDALNTKMRQFEQKREEYFQFRQSVDTRAENEYNARITPILDQVKTIVERIAKEEDYGLVVDSAALAVLYIDADYDLTDKVLAALARGDD